MKRLFPSLPENASLGDVFAAFPGTIRPLLDYHDRLLRGPGALEVADRELIAAYVSGLNACAFCQGAHTTHARAHGIPVETVEALITDLDTAPVDPQLKPLLAYAAKLTRTPSRMTEADAQAVYDAGWSEAALFQAIEVTGLFNLMNRILEGTGIGAYYADPATASEEHLDRLRGATCYSDFGKAAGISD
ncbi:MAG: carboxymuconolactone decarboxylase family protein [Marinibacterium sp.]